MWWLIIVFILLILCGILLVSISGNYANSNYANSNYANRNIRYISHNKFYGGDDIPLEYVNINDEKYYMAIKILKNQRTPIPELQLYRDILDYNSEDTSFYMIKLIQIMNYLYIKINSKIYTLDERIIKIIISIINNIYFIIDDNGNEDEKVAQIYIVMYYFILILFHNYKNSDLLIFKCINDFLLDFFKVFYSLLFTLKQFNSESIFQIEPENQSSFLDFFEIIRNKTLESIEFQGVINALENRETISEDVIDEQFNELFDIPDYIDSHAPFELYSIIELEYNTEDTYKEIKEYAKYLISQSKTGNANNIRNIKEIVFGNETRDANRDKFLNNLGLVIIGYGEGSYLCMLLYPIIFTALKKYQQSKDLIDSKQFRGEHKSVFGGFTFGGLTEEDIAQLKIENPDITEEEIKQKKIYNIESNLIEKFGDILVHDDNQKEFIKVFKEFKKHIILQSGAISNIRELIRFFYIPYHMAKLWRPMSIKSFTGEYINQYDKNEDHLELPCCKRMKKFIIFAHGFNTPEGLPPTIDLEPNEIVIMSCNPWEPINVGFTSSLIMEFISPINVDSIHYTNIAEFLGASLNDKKRQEQKRNNYCFYTKRCPNLSLQFYNPRDYSRNSAVVSTYQANIPFFTFESPMRYNANTIRELLQKLNSDIEKEDPIRGISGEIISEEVKNLPLNQDNEMPNVLKYLFDNINLTKSIEPMMNNPLLLKYMHRIQDLVKKIDAQEHISYDAPERAVSTYYAHIDFQKQDKGSLLQEIESIREYNKSPHLDWSNNPHKYAIYFVKACRS